MAIGLGRKVVLKVDDSLMNRCSLCADGGGSDSWGLEVECRLNLGVIKVRA